VSSHDSIYGLSVFYCQGIFINTLPVNTIGLSGQVPFFDLINHWNV